jgi:hypothetical protein
MPLSYIKELQSFLATLAMLIKCLEGFAYRCRSQWKRKVKTHLSHPYLQFLGSVKERACAGVIFFAMWWHCAFPSLSCAFGDAKLSKELTILKKHAATSRRPPKNDHFLGSHYDRSFSASCTVLQALKVRS